MVIRANISDEYVNKFGRGGAPETLCHKFASPRQTPVTSRIHVKKWITSNREGDQHDTQNDTLLSSTCGRRGPGDTSSCPDLLSQREVNYGWVWRRLWSGLWHDEWLGRRNVPFLRNLRFAGPRRRHRRSRMGLSLIHISE